MRGRMQLLGGHKFLTCHCKIRKLGCLFGSILVFSVCMIWLSLVEVHLEQYAISQHRNPRFETVHYQEEEFPLLIHQIWFNFHGSSARGEPRASYIEGALTTRRINPEFTYKLWRRKDVEDLLMKRYPWFLQTYRSYPYDIQKVDVARYFIIHHYGGVYLDMDERTKVPLRDIIKAHNLTRYDCAFFSGLPSGVSNHFIVARKESPFISYLIEKLPENNRWLLFPYVTVMWSTGPRYVTARYLQHPVRNAVYVFSRDHLHSYIEMFGDAGSWHEWDGRLLNMAYPFLKLNAKRLAAIAIIVFGVFILGALCIRRSITIHYRV